VSASPFDILAATRSLESTGVPRAQAERIIDTVQQVMEALVANLATKGDLAALRTEMKASIDTLRAETKADTGTLRAKVEALEEKMVTKADLAAVKADLAVVKAELFRALWLQGVSLAIVTLTGVGILLTLFRMF